MRLYKCDKTVLRFQPKAAQFLNGYMTNVPEAPRTAFTDIQGRIIAVAHQHKVSEDEVHILVEDQFVDRLFTHLNKYLPLSETAVQKLRMNVYWDVETHQLGITDQTAPVSVSEEEYTLYRVQHNAPLQGVDFDQEMVLNLGDESLISYSKGCYLGQEIVARVHYRGRPPKQLVVKCENDCSPEERGRMTSKVFDPLRGEFCGFVFDKTGDEV